MFFSTTTKTFTQGVILNIDNTTKDGSLPQNQLLQNLQNEVELNSTADCGSSGYPSFNSGTDIGSVLPNTISDYQQTWETWASKAAIRVMITSPDQQFLIIGTGYLLDNSIKVYRYNDQLHEYVHVTDLGDGIIQSDVVSLAWGDTDHNNFPEIIAGSADGHVYIFEQTAIYDPKTNLENNFELVYTGPFVGQVWGVALADTDLDSTPDVITGSWDGTVRWYEYTDHSGYPFSIQHWIDYKQKFIAILPNHDKVTSIQTGDINGNGLPDIVVGTWSGAVYIYENNGTDLILQNGQQFPLAQDNSYKLIYSNTNQFWNPITRIVKGNLDTDPQDEFGLLVPGQGVFTLDYDNNSNQFYFNKLVADVLPAPNYELGANGGVLNNKTVDFATNTYVDFVDYGYNIYGRNNANTAWISEPNFNNYGNLPYNTSLAHAPNGNFTAFGNPNIGSIAPGDNATAVADFGFGQEVTGDGRVTDGFSLKGYDLQIIMNSTPEINQWNLSISRDEKTWFPIPKSDMANGGYHNGLWYLVADTDPTLNLNQSLYYRYLKMVYTGSAIAYVDSVNSTTLARALTQATAIGIGHIDTSYFNLFLNTGTTEPDKIITGTSDGKLYVHAYDATVGQVKMVYDFYGGAAGDRFNLGNNIWDIVQVKNTGTLPTWFSTQYGNETINFNNYPTLGSFYSDTYAHLNALELIQPYFSRPNQDLIVTNTVGDSYLFYAGTPMTITSNTNYFLSQVNNYYGKDYGGIGNPVSLGFGDSNGDNYTDVMVAASWNQVVADPLSSTSSTIASLRIWFSSKTSSGFTPFTGNIDLSSLETTGSLKTALKYTQAKPGVALVDLDGDGDLDIVFTNGHVYVLWILGNYLVWRLDTSYFSQINDNLSSYLYYAPTALDVDMDGDMDLIFSYALTGSRPRYGAVYYRNDGLLNGQTVWTLQQGLFINPTLSTNLAFNNFTSFAFTIDYHTGKILNMTAYNNFTNAIYGFRADYVSHDNFIVATDPLLYRVEINLRDSPSFKNYGYRIAETWDTANEISKFTQSIQTSDLDKDGRGELVVGDYDNNMYIFEYLTGGSNSTGMTYKIAYKSPNLVQHQTLSQTPYAADQLPGLNGNFTRTIWRDAKFVMAGVDLNNNGRQEVVVTAGLAFYIFELDSAGNDLYDLIYTQDLSNSIFQPLIGKYSEFTALGGGTDSDYNGRGEIMLAVGPALFIFEYAGAGSFEEIYAGYPALGGRYFSVGNPIFANYFNDWVYQNLVITSIAVGDVNQNNYEDIVVGGYYNEPYGRLDGSLTILENRLGTIVPVFEFSPHDMQEAPVNDIKLVDQDYDRNIEILVANDKGVDIWEYQPNVNNSYIFNRVGQISSSMNHPIPSVNYVGATFSQPDKTIVDPSQDLLVVRTGFMAPDGVTKINPGDLIEVTSVTGKLVMAYSKNNGKTWNFIKNGNFTFITGGLTAAYSKILSYVEYDPSIIQLPDGDIAIAYMTNVTYLGFTFTWVMSFQLLFSTTASSFTTPFYVNNTQMTLGSPTIFVDPNAGYSSGEFSIAYLDYATHRIYVARGIDSASVSPSIQVPKSIFGKPDKSDNATFLAQSIDVAYYPLTNQYVMAFSGRIYNETKYDADIFTSVSSNDSLIPLYTSRVSSASTQDRYPSISVLQDSHSYGLVLVYEEQGIDPGNRIMASHSNDIGRSWNPPEPMNNVPDYLVNICFTQLNLGCFMFIVSDPTQVNQANPALHPGLDYSDTIIYDAQQAYQGQKDYANQTYFNSTGLQFYWVTSVVVQKPAIAGRVTGGFAYSFSSNVYLGSFANLLYQIITAMARLGQGRNLASAGSFGTQQVAYLAGDRLVSNTLTIGKFASIGVGVNPSSEFIKFDLGKALQIDTGDTDGDGRREIVIASDRGVFLNEISSTSAKSQTYDPIWEKTDYTFGIHDVALGDTNNNGFDEIFVAGEYGNVFAYEMMDTSAKITDFDFTKLQTSTASEFTDQVAPDLNHDQNLIKTLDINGDGIQDLIYPSFQNGSSIMRIYAVDGKNMDIHGHQLSLWNYSLPQGGENITTMDLYDVTGDGIPDVIVGTSLGQIYILNSHTGAIEHIYATTGPSIQQLLVGTFSADLSFVIISKYDLLLFDPIINRLYYIATSPITEGPFTDMVSVVVENNGLMQLLAVTSKGIARVYDLLNITSTGPAVYLTLNSEAFGQYGNYKQIKDYYTSVGKYDLNGAGFDNMFLAINSTVFAFDHTGKLLWNRTDLQMSRNLDKLTVVHDPTSGENIILLASYPKSITFEDYATSGANIISYMYNNYSYLGVTFSPNSWEVANLTNDPNAGDNYYNNTAHSGDFVGVVYQPGNQSIVFNQTQQYVSFYITMQYDSSVRILGLDEANKTVYVSKIYNSGVNQLVSIILNQPSLKRIIFEGQTDFILTIDDLEFGGTTIFALDAQTGSTIWSNQFYPTHSVAINPYVDSNNNLIDPILPVTYSIDPSFNTYLGKLNQNTAMYGLNLETGKTEFMTYPNSYGSSLSGVNLGQGIFGYISYYPYSFDHKYYSLYTYERINNTYGTYIPYQAQNDASWQINSGKYFTHIVTGQLDTDPYNEMIVYNNRLIAAIDNNGNFLWKFVTSVDIDQILLANFNNTGIDNVVVLLKDNTIMVLDAMFGVELSSQTLPFFVPVKMMAVVNDTTGILQLIVAESNPADTAGILLSYNYQPGTDNFTLASHSKAYAGSLKDVFITDFDGDTKNNDYLLYFDSELILLKNNFNFKTNVTDSIKAVSVGDYNNDGKTDFAYINASSFLVVRQLDLSYISQRHVSTGLILIPGMNALYSVDLTGDNIPEIVQYQFGVGYALYNASNGNLMAFWQDRAFMGGFLTTMDIDFDGINELILRNERLVYAVKYNPYTQQLYTSWSSPLSLVPILQATPAKLNNSNTQLVFLNMFGQIFAVKGISYPYTSVNYDLRFNYQSTKSPIKNIDTFSWQTSTWPVNLFDSPNAILPPVIKQPVTDTIINVGPQSGKNVDVSLPIEIFAVSFIAGVVTIFMLRKKVKRIRTFKNTTKADDFTNTGGSQL